MHQSLENHEHLIKLFQFNQNLMKTKDTIHSNNQLLDSTRQVKHWQSSPIHLWITQHTSRYFSKWKSLDWFDGGFRFRWSPLDEQTASQLLSGSLRAGSGRRSCTKWSSGTHFCRNPSSCVVPAGLFSALWAECGPWTSGKRRNHFQDPSAKMTAELRPSVSTAALDVPVMASWCWNKTNHLRAFTNFP